MILISILFYFLFNFISYYIARQFYKLHSLDNFAIALKSGLGLSIVDFIWVNIKNLESRRIKFRIVINHACAMFIPSFFCDCDREKPQGNRSQRTCRHSPRQITDVASW